MERMESAIFQILVLIFSVMIHEVAHGLMAENLGDPTARQAGRLTFNPLKHLDPFGSFIFPLLLILASSPVVFGWAKPVPYNPFLLVKDPKRGPLKVALAGPAANLAIAVVLGLALRFGGGLLPGSAATLLGFVVFLNILLAVFNLVPLPPLDGSKILTVFLPDKYSLAWQSVGLGGLFLVVAFLYLFGNYIFLATSWVFQAIVGASFY